MSEPERTAVRLKVDDAGKIPSIVDPYLKGSNPPDLVLLHLDSEKFPRRTMDLPEDVRKYMMTHPRVKVEWNCSVDKFDIYSDYCFLPVKLGFNTPFIDERKLKVSLITCHYGGKMNFSRKTAMLQAMYNWFIQSHIPNDILFIELVIDGESMFSQKDFPSFVKYVRVEGNKSNKGVFQKECLWNIGAKLAVNNKMIFIDYDTSPVGDVDWFYKIDKKLDKSLFTQGFRKINYLNQDGSSQFSNYCMTYVIDNNLERGDAVPGGSYCIRRELYDVIGGFNDRCFSGCGDAVFFNELQKKYIETYYYNISVNMTQRNLDLKLIYQMAGKLGMNLFGSLDVDVCHYFHGNLSDRSYNVREYLALMLYPFNDYFRIDEQGLISWKYTDVSLYDSFCAINKINNSISNAQKIIGKDIDLAFFKKRIDQIRKEFEKTQSWHILNSGMNQMIDYIKENYWLKLEGNQT